MLTKLQTYPLYLSNVGKLKYNSTFKIFGKKKEKKPCEKKTFCHKFINV